MELIKVILCQHGYNDIYKQKYINILNLFSVFQKHVKNVLEFYICNTSSIFFQFSL